MWKIPQESGFIRKIVMLDDRVRSRNGVWQICRVVSGLPASMGEPRSLRCRQKTGENIDRLTQNEANVPLKIATIA